MSEEYIPVVTVAVRGLTPSEGIEFAEKVTAFVEAEGFAEDAYYVELVHGTYDPEDSK